MDLFTLQCFIAVAESKSFTKAAEQVKRTQSAVTQQIRNLEKLIEKKLFIRGGEVKLTKEGEILLSYAKKIFSLTQEALDRFKQPELEGELRFGLPEDYATRFLSEVLTEFSRIHPRIFLNVECNLTMNLYEQFKRGKFDMVLVKMTQPEDFPNGVEIWSEPLVWIGNGDLKQTYENKNPLPLILSPAPCVYRQRALDALSKNDIPWRIAFTSSSYVGTIAAVKASLGFTVLPRTMIPDELHKMSGNYFPPLPDIHISLLKQTMSNESLNTLEEFILKKL